MSRLLLSILSPLVVLVVLLLMLPKTDCNNDGDAGIKRCLERDARTYVLAMNEEQKAFYLKNNKFLEKQLEPSSNPFNLFTNVEKCYKFYSEIKFSTVFNYGRNYKCGGQFGYDLTNYVGIVALANIEQKNAPKLLSVICERKVRITSRNQFSQLNGTLKCPLEEP